MRNRANQLYSSNSEEEREGRGGGGSLVTAETVFMIILLITESPGPGQVQAANNDVGKSRDEIFTNNLYLTVQPRPIVSFHVNLTFWFRLLLAL